MAKAEGSESPAGTQTLIRGLAVIDAVAGGARTLQSIGTATGCTRSTTHRLVSALTGTDHLGIVPGLGYVLGSKLMALGYLAREQLPLSTIARPHLEILAERTQDTVHLGLTEGSEVFYLDKLPAKRGLEMRSRIGFRMPLAFTGIGKAMMLDMAEDRWLDLYESGRLWHEARGTAPSTFPPLNDFMVRMHGYAEQSCAYDLEENETGVRCVAAPIRDASGSIVAALSVASAAQYMPLERLPELRPQVIATAAAISRELGWREKSAANKQRPTPTGKNR
jgi:DNA-binding IclR family transcriptional regulator